MRPASKSPKNTNARQAFVVTALNMSWQLAIVVLVPVFVGVQADKHFGTGYIWTFVGLGLALAGTGVVMWRAIQVANQIPVPKLTEKQRREVRKRFDAEDDE